MGCGESEKIDPVEEEVIIADADGDGHFEGKDCDDNNSSINIDAIEICDGLITIAMEKLMKKSCQYFMLIVMVMDLGTPMSMEECEGSTGFVGNASDCDDSDEQSFLVQRVHDERDNDCNGEIDDGIGQTFYVDSDNDGLVMNPSKPVSYEFSQ